MSQQSSDITQGWKELLGRDSKVFCRDNPEISRDILKVNGEGIVSRHYFLCRNKRQFCRDKKYQEGNTSQLR